MKAIKNSILVLVLASGSLTLNAQQAPMYTHYMYNTLVINPGYAGSRDALTATALYRAQWVGFKGAPVTQTFTMHSPLRNEHIGVGFAVMNDKSGPINNTSLVGDFAYRAQLTRKAKLALGISLGANMAQANLSTLQTDQPNDPLLQTNVNNKINPNVGLGAYYSRDRFYAGVSVPNILENGYSTIYQPNGSTIIGKNTRSYFFIAGSMIKITDNLAFKPTTLVKVTSAAPTEIDLTASFIIMQKLLIGAMYRSGDATGVLVGFDLTEMLHIGYSYDWSYGLRTGMYNQGSHEIMARYDFMHFNKKQIHSPRHF